MPPARRLPRLDAARRPRGEPMTQPSPADRELHPAHPPVVPIAQAPFVPQRRRLQRLVDLFPAGQFVRYLCVGVFNTLFGYAVYVVLLASLHTVLPVRWLYLTVVLVSLLAAPLTITVAYLGYKFFVFRTRGQLSSRVAQVLRRLRQQYAPRPGRTLRPHPFSSVNDSQPRGSASLVRWCAGTAS